MKIKYTSEKFIELAKEKYNNFFDYSLVHKDFKNIASKVRIICPKHGEFIQNANNHLNGRGCKFCNKEKLNGNSKYTGAVLLAKFNELYNEKYSYNLNLDEQYRVTDKINFICPIHGKMNQMIRIHLKGKGCKKCIYENRQPKTLGQFILEKAKNIHGEKYHYSIDNKALYYATEKMEIICPIHGPFKQQIRKHLEGRGCKKCGRNICRNLFVKTTEEFIADSKKIHEDTYDYSKSIYVKSHDKLIITCKKHGDFFQKPYSHLHGHGCPKCLSANHKLEKEILEFVKSLKIKVKANDRTILFDESTKFYKEIDIYMPELNKGIEVNGIYWHKVLERMKPGYHKNKNQLFKKYKIDILNVSDISWIKNKKNVKERIKKFILG